MLFVHIPKTGGASVEQLLRNEHLIDIDTTLRVRLPQLEPVQLHPPWEPGGNTDVDETTLQTQRTMMRHFSEQTLKPGEEVRMPVLFYVDPKALDDPNMAGVRQITLSYTFHKSKDAS